MDSVDILIMKMKMDGKVKSISKKVEEKAPPIKVVDSTIFNKGKSVETEFGNILNMMGVKVTEIK